MQKTFDSFSGEPGLFLFTTKTGASHKEEYPSSYEFSRGTDISVFADVTRGHRGKKSAFIEFRETQKKGKIEKIEMLATPVLGGFEFVVPSLQDTFSYRVVTPSLKSDWQTLQAYDPPSVQSVNWNITPPPYLKMDDITNQSFGYVRVPEGE